VVWPPTAPGDTVAAVHSRRPPRPPEPPRRTPAASPEGTGPTAAPPGPTALLILLVACASLPVRGDGGRDQPHRGGQDQDEAVGDGGQRSQEAPAERAAPGRLESDHLHGDHTGGGHPGQAHVIVDDHARRCHCQQLAGDRSSAAQNGLAAGPIGAAGGKSPRPARAARRRPRARPGWPPPDGPVGERLVEEECGDEGLPGLDHQAQPPAARREGELDGLPGGQVAFVRQAGPLLLVGRAHRRPAVALGSPAAERRRQVGRLHELPWAVASTCPPFGLATSRSASRMTWVSRASFVTRRPRWPRRPPPPPPDRHRRGPSGTSQSSSSGREADRGDQG
jgi:hypothetical protein